MTIYAKLGTYAAVGRKMGRGASTVAKYIKMEGVQLNIQIAKLWYGRLFIHTYYAISPIHVKWFGSTNWFKSMWKPTLEKMVIKLNSKGIENTPYNDKQW